MTTQDLFYIILSVCAALVSFFVLLNLYYIFRLSRDIRGITKDARKKIQRLLGIIDDIREKLASSISSAQNITDTAKEVVGFVSEMRGLRVGGSKKKTRGRKTSG